VVLKIPSPRGALAVRLFDIPDSAFTGPNPRVSTIELRERPGVCFLSFREVAPGVSPPVGMKAILERVLLFRK
jgi:hypothetical protein